MMKITFAFRRNIIVSIKREREREGRKEGRERGERERELIELIPHVALKSKSHQGCHHRKFKQPRDPPHVSFTKRIKMTPIKRISS